MVGPASVPGKNGMARHAESDSKGGMEGPRCHVQKHRSNQVGIAVIAVSVLQPLVALSAPAAMARHARVRRRPPRHAIASSAATKMPAAAVVCGMTG